MVISHGAAGLVAAVERNWPHRLRQRCVIHRARDVLAKVPKNAQEEVEIAYWKLFDVPDKIAPGQKAVDYVQKRIDEFVDRYHKRFAAAVRCLEDDRTALTAYLRFPRDHWSRTRHSNQIERTFGQTRRRTKLIGRFPGQTSCVTLVWAVLERASAGWRGLTMSPRRHPAAAGPPPPAARPTHRVPATTRTTNPAATRRTGTTIHTEPKAAAT
jgi:transposase-like protein